MTCLMVGTVNKVPARKLLVLFFTCLLVSCTGDDQGIVDSSLLVGAWSGETERVSWCVDMTEDLRYRSVQYDKKNQAMRLQLGSFELQRGKRKLTTTDIVDESGYLNWVAQENPTRRRDLVIVSNISETEMVVKVLVIHPAWTTGVDSVSKRVESCIPKYEELKEIMLDVKSKGMMLPDS